MSPLSQFYTLVILPALQEVAKVNGYALTFHGSADRDLDLVAVPWVQVAAPAEVLVRELALIVGGRHDEPASRPHGRRTWVITFAPTDLFEPPYPYIDISVMPRSQDDAHPL